MGTMEERVRPIGVLSVRHIATRNGRVVPVHTIVTPRLRKFLEGKGIDADRVFKNLVVNTGRGKLARLLGGATNSYINRVQLGDTRDSAGIVQKSSFPPDLSDTRLVNEIRTLAGQPGATFDLDSTTYPDEVNKVDASVGTPGTLTAGAPSLLSDATGVDFVTAGITDRDTVTVVLNGEDYTLGVISVISPTSLEVANPSQLAGAVGYTVQTPGTQVLFSKLVNGDNFPEAEYGTAVVAHEAGLLFNDDTLFNRVTFQQNDDSLGVVLQPTDIDGTRIDVQLDWLITF